MIKINKMSDINIQQVYPAELTPYKALVNIESGIYHPPVGPDYRLDILTSEPAGNKKVNIQLQLTVMGRTMTLPINFIATDGRWLYENILEHKFLGKE